MSSTSKQKAQYQGPALLSHGFRPFFLAASVWATVGMLLWIAMLSGTVSLPLRFDPFSWHAHEFLFGYVGAVICGFALTAAPNWTGRPPLAGWPLLALLALWVAGRVAVALSDLLPWQAVALVDLSLMAALLLFLAQEIIRGRNWRNLPVVLLIGLHGLANGMFHVEVAMTGAASSGLGMRLGLATALLLIILIGGRIIPSFTRNWLAAKGVSHLPIPFNRSDGGILALTAITLAAFVAAPGAWGMTSLLAATGSAHLWRLSRWCGWHVRSEPLLWSLHLAYAMVAMGFFTNAAAQQTLIAPAAAHHVWLVGAIGLMTLAVMSRASLGHTGHALHAGPGTAALYLSVIGSVVARVGAGLADDPMPFLHLSGALWVSTFAGFTVIYGGMLVRPRQGQHRSHRAASKGDT